MDVICVVSANNLYASAIKNDVPLHKWHTWVERQLNAAYLQSIYSKVSSKGRNSYNG